MTVKLGLLETTPPDRTRNILQIVVRTGGGWSTVITGGATIYHC